MRSWKRGKRKETAERKENIQENLKSLARAFVDLNTLL
jgi:hypothetical protein